ncbi:MAG: DUF2905 domain-containing protein [Chloroflexi bacterium]|nr:DUF2905 domain-containing protein [Chloroflexota bacterium]
MDSFGKILILFGVILVVGGIAITLLGRVPGLGKLPGDFNVEIGNISCFFPIATSILLSLALTIVLNLLYRIINK